MTVVTAIVAVLLATQAAKITESIALQGLRDLATEATEITADQSAGMVRFSRQEQLDALLAQKLADSDGQALATVVIDLDGKDVAVSGTAPPQTLSDLRALAGAASLTGGIESTGDGFLIAAPLRFGADGAVVGAIAMAWTPEQLLSTIAARKRMLWLTAAGVFVILILAGGLALRWSISVPLRRVEEAMQDVASGALDTEIPARARQDEIGTIARSLDGFRQSLEAARKAQIENELTGARFQGASVPRLVIGTDGSVSHVSADFVAFAERHAAAIEKTAPGFDPAALPELGIGSLEKLVPDLRGLLSDASRLPHEVDIRLGETKFWVGISRVQDKLGTTFGTVLEWEDVTSRRKVRATLAALEANQIRCEFDANHRLSDGNARFYALIDRPETDLVGQPMTELVRPGGDETELTAALARNEAYFGRFTMSGTRGDRHVDGSLSPVLDNTGNATSYLLLGQDVTDATERLQFAEEERSRIEAEQQAVVEALRVGMAALSDGDLTARLTTPFAAQYEPLRADFNAAVDRLHAAIAAVTERAGAIRGEVADISGAADDLSRRTEHQAATLEETAAALAEITASVSSAAEGARRANDVVDEARTNAEASGGVVQDAVAAMGEIADSSSKISSIISVIDDIAFQTNLLALNAGVEAARAGDAGRGFAVVASEVRALAQRSSDAAREINSLISASGEHVERGVTLVGDAGIALKRIVESVGGISDHVAGIAASAQEQSSGLAEVNTAMSQLDQVTQQNAAMFEETTAASQTLNSAANELAQSVERFILGSKPPTASTASQTFVSARGAASNPPLPLPSSTTGALATAVPEALSEDQLDEDWQDF
ncbi:MAG: HAMP domain-containing protein [Rhodobacteraceae bacterium]|nr:methyl-accepting chemotaxis protein [Alphaproteobacteria bacterium]NNK68809.1 HAMP domain-containing protein [Paracoccaceae bacterium]